MFKKYPSALHDHILSINLHSLALGTSLKGSRNVGNMLFKELIAPCHLA